MMKPYIEYYIQLYDLLIDTIHYVTMFKFEHGRVGSV